jgi:hypothetical protein
MYPSTYLKWFRRLLILGAVVAGLTASAAGARLDPGTPPDVSDVAFRLSTAPATDVARPPDVRDAAGQVTTSTADVFERYVSTHPYGFAPSSTQIVSRPPDVQDAASALHVTAQGLQADGLRWQAIAQAYQQGGTSSVPDVFERYVSTHPYGFAPSSTQIVSRPPDVQDAASALHVTAQGLQADGLRWQGIAQAYQQAGTSVTSGGGVDWNAYIIGIGSGLGGRILLAAGLTMVTRLQRSHRVQSV